MRPGPCSAVIGSERTISAVTAPVRPKPRAIRGGREAHGERERELNAVQRAQLCTSRRLRAPDHCRAEPAVGEAPLPGAWR